MQRSERQGPRFQFLHYRHCRIRYHQTHPAIVIREEFPYAERTGRLGGNAGRGGVGRGKRGPLAARARCGEQPQRDGGDGASSHDATMRTMRQ